MSVIGAAFDAAVRAGWTYLGDMAAEPMVGPEFWDQLVAGHQPPNVMLVAVDDSDGVPEAFTVRSSSTAAPGVTATAVARLGWPLPL